MYYKIENYVNDEGKILTAKIPQSQSTNSIIADPVVYVGTVPLTVKTPHGATQIPFEFEFPQNMQIETCFEKFEEIANQKIEEFKQEQQDKNRIIPATSVPSDINFIK